MERGDIVMIANQENNSDPDIVRCVQNKWLVAICEVNDADCVISIPKTIDGIDTRFGELSSKEVRIPTESLILIEDIYVNIRR